LDPNHTTAKNVVLICYFGLRSESESRCAQNKSV
jgi:hypothetical protein